MDYNHEAFYWDSFVLIVNLILNCFLIVSENMDSATLAKILMGLFFIAMALTVKKLPSKYKEVNQNNILSFIVIILTLCCISNIILTSEDQSNNLASFYYVVIFISNGFFYSCWIYTFVILTILQKIAERKEKKEKNAKRKEKELKQKETLMEIKT